MHGSIVANRVSMDLNLEKNLEQKYRNTSFKRAEYLATNDSKRANREFDKLTKLRREGLRSLPDRGEAILKRLAESPDAACCPYVLIDAAADLLAVDEAYAIKLLENVAKGTGLEAFTAEMTVKEWRKGKLREFLA